MKTEFRRTRPDLVLLFLGIALLHGAAQIEAAEAPRLLYASSFEPAENFQLPWTLSGQSGWTGYGKGGTGLVADHFWGLGNQGYVGYHPPLAGEDTISVYHPISFTPIDRSRSVVQFSVTFEIVDSTNGHFDDFRWSFYNLAGDRLFSIDFDNATQEINYSLDNDQGFIPTRFNFDHGGG